MVGILRRMARKCIEAGNDGKETDKGTYKGYKEVKTVETDHLIE